VKNALDVLKVHGRDEAVTNSRLFELVAGGFVVRPGKPQQDQMLVAFAQPAYQPERLLVGCIGRFQIENEGFKRDLIEQRQYLFTRAQECGVEDRRQYFLGRQLHRFIRGHNRYARRRASRYSIYRHKGTSELSS
jgi:hypothetical protein